MIIYGSKNKELATETLLEKCPNCGTQNSIDMHVFQKYAHVFWIPIFPLPKTGVSQCDHCKQTLKQKDMPLALTLSYDNLKAQTKTPIWMFTGLAIIAAFVIISVVSDMQKDKKNAVLILTPKSGDIFEVKTKENQYTLYKVTSVSKDSTFVQKNNFETDLQTGLEAIKRKGDAVYAKEVLGFSNAELKQMLEKGEILDIYR